MTEWPAGVRVAPIREWPGPLTPDHKRRRSQFGSPLSSTAQLLRRELRELAAKDAELLIAIPAEQFRLDGYPRATAKAEHPGVILSFASRHGQLSYPCDTFTEWQDNLRAVALALEALRKVDRYGVTRHGEQYRGFAALTAGPGGAAPEFFELEGAWKWLLTLTNAPTADIAAENPNDIAAQRRAVLRMAKRVAHPDHGGTAAEFDTVMRAEQLLRDGGLI